MTRQAWAAILTAIGLLGTGYAVGSWVEGRKVDHLVAEASKKALAQAKQTNEDNARLRGEVARLELEHTALETKLGEALAKAATKTATRIVWRERESAKPDCRAWLAGPVPCRLRPVPDDDARSRAPGPGPGS